MNAGSHKKKKKIVRNSVLRDMDNKLLFFRASVYCFSVLLYEAIDCRNHERERRDAKKKVELYFLNNS